MTNIFTKRTIAGVLAVLCAAGTVPAGAATNGFSGITSLMAYADTEKEIVASVHEVATLDEFLEAANSAENGDTIKLVDSFDITGAHTIDNGKSFTVDFNGNVIWFDSMGNRDPQTYFYINNANTHITFLDSGYYGGMFAENPNVVRFLKVRKGTVELLSGRYTGGHDISRTESDDAHIYIKGGYYDLQTDDRDGPFYRNGSGHYYLTGGYFTERTDLKENIAEPAEGHEYYDLDDDYYSYGIRKTGATSVEEKKFDLDFIPDQEYTGSKVTPPVIANCPPKGPLEENVDYTVSYDENIEVGTATVYINGIGDFYGSTTISFKIKKMPEYTIPKNVRVPFGHTLCDAELPTAENGTWHWENEKAEVGAAGTKTFKAIFVPNDTEKYLRVEGIDVPVTVYHTYKKVKAVEPTCTKDGNIEFYICSDGKYYTDNQGKNEVALEDTIIPAKGHSYGEPKWTWSDMTSTAAPTAKATFKCKVCGNSETVDAVVKANIVNPTYTENGKYVYTATAKVGGKTYTSTKEVTIPMLKLTHVEAVAPTCTQKGNIEYWYDEANNKYFIDSKGISEITKSKTIIDALGHKFGEPVWTWNKKYTTAAISFPCTQCNTVQGTTAVIKSVKTEPTYTKEGKIVYTATAKFEGKTYTDTQEVRIPKLIYNAPEITYEQGYGAVKLNWTEVEGAEKYAIVACISGRWSIIGENKGTSYVLNDLKEGQEYKVAVIAYAYGDWVTNVTNAIVVSPKDTTTKYPVVKNIDYNEEFHQFRLTWSKVKDAQNYGVAVYLAGKWVILDQKIPASTPYYTSPKLNAGQTYKMVICAKVGGKWDITALNTRTFEVTVK